MDALGLSWSIALAAAPGAGLHRMPIAMLGVRYKGKQKIEITKAMLADVVRNFRKMDTGQVPVDYDHAIEFAAGGGQPVPASGWIKSIEDAPDEQGILWGQVEWTEKAQKAIAAKEYQFISPVIDPTIRDNKTGDPQGWTLTSAALTNQPVLQGMPALVLSESGWKEIGRDAAEKETTVKVAKLILADRAAGTVRAVLDDGSEVTVKLEGLEAPPKVLRLSDVKRDPKSQALDFASLDCSGDALVAGEVFRAHQAQLALETAIKEGKVLPAQRPQFEKMAMADLAGFVSLVASMKPQIDLGTRGTGATEGAPESGGVGARVAIAAKQRIVASNGRLDYGEAMRLVLRDDAELAAAYRAEVRGGGKQ